MNYLLLILIPLGTLSFISILGGIHIIHEGHVGIYTRGGALLMGYTDPGLHTMVPIITRFHEVQITIQTDKVLNIPCGTSGGVMLYFDKIEVVNRLQKEWAFETIKNYTIDYDKTWIFDKIHHEINQFCSSHTLQEVYITKFDQLDEALKSALQEGCNKWAPGIEIIAVRVTKPNIPENIRSNYEKMEDEKTKLLIALEAQQVQEKESETLKILEKIEAETKAEVSKIQMTQELLIKEISQKLEEIENQINLEKQMTIANSTNYKTLKEIEINQQRLSKEYLERLSYESVKDVPKYFFGSNIQEFFQDNFAKCEKCQKK